jgi:hypothetical protein
MHHRCINAIAQSVDNCRESWGRTGAWESLGNMEGRAVPPDASICSECFGTMSCGMELVACAELSAKILCREARPMDLTRVAVWFAGENSIFNQSIIIMYKKVIRFSALMHLRAKKCINFFTAVHVRSIFLARF